jgi:hypothetical protein
VTSNLTSNPNVNSSYNSPDGKSPLALVALQIASPNQAPGLSTSFTTSARFSFDTTSLQSGKLLVGLLDPVSGGPGFTSLHFSIVRTVPGPGGPANTTLEDQIFAGASAATTYFNDHALDLGPMKIDSSGLLDITFLLEMTTIDNGTFYSADFLVADVGMVAVPGDYNRNGAVDAADYVLWRKFNNTATTLPNDSTPGTDASDYAVWRAHFGQMAGSGSGAVANATVPEPATVVLLTIATAGLCVRRSRTG